MPWGVLPVGKGHCCPTGLVPYVSYGLGEAVVGRGAAGADDSKGSIKYADGAQGLLPCMLASHLGEQAGVEA